MPQTRIDQGSVPRRIVCASGPTAFYIAPINRIGYVTEIHVDTEFSSTGEEHVFQLVDRFQALGGSTGDVIRYQALVVGGDGSDLSVDAGVKFFGELRVDVNSSGPIVSLGAVFR